jgi:23S rRNA (pseudouridine1915-N3)-methyltransferase
MRLHFISVGKAPKAAVRELIDEYTARLQHYYKCSWQYLPNAGKQQESEALLACLKSDDIVVLLDERGKQLTNQELARYIEDKAVAGTSRLVFIIGGAFGVDGRIVQRANLVWSLSQLVLPHQIVRIVLSEQLYRSCTITSGLPYHHQ